MASPAVMSECMRVIQNALPDDAMSLLAQLKHRENKEELSHWYPLRGEKVCVVLRVCCNFIHSNFVCRQRVLAMNKRKFNL